MIALLLLTAVQTPAAPEGGLVDFNRDVRPILSENCFLCHGPDAGTREAGLRLDSFAGATADLDGYSAVVPGDLDDSELWFRISNDDVSDRMPPRKSGKTLSPEQIRTLRRWIEQGAGYAAHWSFVAPEKAALPVVHESGWPRNPIDHFLLERLEREDMLPAPEADAERWLRRVTFDLTGLPPTLAEIDEFLADSRPGAYARVVERLLANPAHAEHMARFWLDAARYGDTHGLHLDNFRSIHRYRDWVIEAYAENRRYDQFVVDQLAGDLLPEPDLDQLLATGFNRCNPTSAEGGMIAEEFLAKYAMDRVDTFGTVLLGLSVGCAQCHDHKFDPITQEEYYRLYAFFNNIAEEASDGNGPAPAPVVQAPTPAQAAEQDALGTSLAQAQARLDAPLPAVDRAQLEWQNAAYQAAHERWQPLSFDSLNAFHGSTLTQLPDLSVHATGANPDVEVFELRAPLPAAGLTALRLDVAADPATPAAAVGRSANGNVVLTAVEAFFQPAAGGDAVALELGSALADHAQDAFPVANALDGSNSSGWALLPEVKQEHSAWFPFVTPLAPGRDGQLVLRLRFESVHRQHVLARFQVSSTADPALSPVRMDPWWQTRFLAAASGSEAYATVYPPEQGRLPGAEGGRGVEDEILWQARAEDQDGVLHLLEGEVGSRYLFREIHSPNARSLTVMLGSDDALRVWLNGEAVLEREVRRALALGQDQVELPLSAGSNQLLIKIVNYGGGFGYAFEVRSAEVGGLAPDLALALEQADPERSLAQKDLLRSFYRRRHSPEWAELAAQAEAVEAQLSALTAQVPTSLITRERAEIRPAFLLTRGQYDQPAQQVQPGVPAALPPLSSDGRATRLDLAQWLVDPQHPLTARVQVNRLWQQFFGVGLVRTAEDFGSQGEWPSHPRLLDWLAREFADSGWDVRHVIRLIVLSSAYRQNSAFDAAKSARDPDNRLLARGPRFRLDAEVIRDAALSISELLQRQIGGPSVKPYQPAGLWKAVAYTSSNTAVFQADEGAALYRRSLYTFWKRTAPPPMMSLFDAPTRESCVVRRERTNTPLQALALMNDVQFLEAARVLAETLVGSEDLVGLIQGFRRCTARLPTAEEVRLLNALLVRQRRVYAQDPTAAAALVAVGDSAPAMHSDAAELAAWTAVASVLLNLDETVTRL